MAKNVELPDGSKGKLSNTPNSRGNYEVHDSAGFVKGEVSAQNRFAAESQQAGLNAVNSAFAGVPAAQSYASEWSGRQAEWTQDAMPVVLWIISWTIRLCAAWVPIWTRVFIHPSVILFHRKRILQFTAVFGTLGVITSWEKSGPYSLVFFVVGGLSYVMTYVQIALSVRHLDKVSGGGHGLLNLYTLISHKNILPILTPLQEGALAVLLLVNGIRNGGASQLMPSIFIFVYFVGYTWWCQYQFSEYGPEA